MPDKILFVSRHYQSYKMKCPNPMYSDASSIKIRRSSGGKRKLKKDAFCSTCMTRYAIVEFDLDEPPLIVQRPPHTGVFFTQYTKNASLMTRSL